MDWFPIPGGFQCWLYAPDEGGVGGFTAWGGPSSSPALLWGMRPFQGSEEVAEHRTGSSVSALFEY